MRALKFRAVTEPNTSSADTHLDQMSKLKSPDSTAPAEISVSGYIDRLFDSSKEDVDAYANEIFHLTGIAFPDWDAPMRDDSACRFFWRELSGVPATKQLLARFKREEASKNYMSTGLGAVT